MALHETNTNPAFRSGVRASGLGEVWTHTHDQLKFTQFGWRCTTKESSYSDKTLIGNWSEERFDIHRTLENRPLPSQFDHYFEQTSLHDYSRSKNPTGIDNSATRLELKKIAGKDIIAFPGHQPELDHHLDKEMYNSSKSTAQTDYCHPDAQIFPAFS